MLQFNISFVFNYSGIQTNENQSFIQENKSAAKKKGAVHNFEQRP